MHLTTTNPVSGVWHQNTRAGVIPAISFTRLLRRNARISAHAMRMCAYAHIFTHAMRMRIFFAHAMRMRAFDANARTCAHFPACDAMRCECANAMRCECAHQGGTYACPVLYEQNLLYIVGCRVVTKVRRMDRQKDGQLWQGRTIPYGPNGQRVKMT